MHEIAGFDVQISEPPSEALAGRGFSGACVAGQDDVGTVVRIVAATASVGHEVALALKGVKSGPKDLRRKSALSASTIDKAPSGSVFPSGTNHLLNDRLSNQG